MLRIISGFLKGRKLVDSSNYNLRPTTDHNRQALFNIVQSGKLDFDLNNARVLDLCCGTGAFAIEAISRGASKAVCVDKDRKNIELVRKNIEKLGIANQIDIKNIDANNLSQLKNADKFDLVFIDPPYLMKIDGIIKSLLDYELISNNSLIITETGNEFETELLNKLDSRKYGISYFGFFKAI